MKFILFLIIFPAVASAQVHHYRSFERSIRPIADTIKPAMWVSDSSNITLDVIDSRFVVEGPYPDRLRIIAEAKHKKVLDIDEFDYSAVDANGSKCSLSILMYSDSGKISQMVIIESPTTQKMYHFFLPFR